MLTRRFYIILIGIILVAICSIWWAPLLTVAYIACLLLAIATAADLVYTLVISRLIRTSRHTNDHMSLDQPNAVDCQVSINGARPLKSTVVITTQDTPPRSMEVRGPESIVGEGTLHYYVVPTTRGRHEFGKVRCHVRTRMLSLVEMRRFISVSTIVHVYPTFRRLEDIESRALSMTTHGQRRIRRIANNTEFEQIRPYVTGDDIRTINWRATARAANLMVNTYSDERSRPIVPIVCAGPSMLAASDGITLLDRAVSAAVALGSAALRRYDEVGLMTVTHTGVESFLSPERSQSTLSKMLNMTYDFGLPPTDSEHDMVKDQDVLPDDVDPAKLQMLLHRISTCEADADIDSAIDYALSRLHRRTLLVLFANFENEAVAQRAIPKLHQLAKRHTLVVVLFVNESVHQVMNEPYRHEGVSNKLERLRFRNMCCGYIEQQRALAEKMHSFGINVLLTTPENLTASVLQRYVDIKQTL